MATESFVQQFKPKEPSAVAQAAREISCGTIAGFFGKFVDFPFDTVKVRLQAEPCPYKGTIDCIRRVALEEGFWGFYSGIASPCIGSAFENAAAFMMFGQCSKLLMNHFGPTEEGAMKPLWIVSSAGAFSGIGTGTVLTPVEFVKGRVQVNPKKYPSVPSAVKTVLKEEGAKALYNGYSATLAREVPGNAMWFLTYELALRNLFIPMGKTRDDAPWYAFPCSGAVGGVFYWGTFYPTDVIKTRMQTDPTYASLSLPAAFRRVYKEGGVGALYLGIGITLARAAPANATIFGLYEAANRNLPAFNF